MPQFCRHSRMWVEILEPRCIPGGSSEKTCCSRSDRFRRTCNIPSGRVRSDVHGIQCVFRGNTTRFWLETCVRISNFQRIVIKSSWKRICRRWSRSTTTGSTARTFTTKSISRKTCSTWLAKSSTRKNEPKKVQKLECPGSLDVSGAF